MASSVPVLILGGGLAGLSAARHLRSPFRLIERASKVGGHAVTVEEESYRFDRTGHLLHVTDPEMLGLVRGLLGDQLLSIERQSRVWSHGVYTHYPFQANVFGLPADVARECVAGFVRAHFARGQSEPRDFEEFVLARFGEGIARHFMVPYNEKMWGVHPREITAEWCSRFVPLPTLDDVVRGAAGAPARALGYNATFLYPKRGIGALPEALAHGLRGVHTSRTPVRIDLVARTVHLEDGESIGFDVLLSTIPLKTLVGLCKGAPPEIGAAADLLRCNPLYYLDVALTTAARVDWHWAYVPEPDVPFYRVGCYSNFSSALVPAGGGSLYVELASRTEPDLPGLWPRVLAALVRMGVVQGPSDVRFVRMRRVEFAYVVFDHRCYASVEAIRPWLAENRILSTGRYGGWNYSAMGDALAMGKDAARAAEQLLQSPDHS